MKKTSNYKSKKNGKEENEINQNKNVRKGRRQHTRGIRGLARSQQRRGGVAPRQKNRIHHQEEHGSETKSEGDTRNTRKTPKTKSGKRGAAKWKEETKEKRQGCPVGTMLTPWVSRGGTHHGDGHDQAFIALTWVIEMRSLSYGEYLNVVSNASILLL